MLRFCRESEGAVRRDSSLSAIDLSMFGFSMSPGTASEKTALAKRKSCLSESASIGCVTSTLRSKMSDWYNAVTNKLHVARHLGGKEQHIQGAGYRIDLNWAVLVCPASSERG